MPGSEDKIVREFRHILLWPLQLRRMGRASGFKTHWEALKDKPGPWTYVKDNLLIDDETCARLGRPSPPSWEHPGQATHCTWQVEFLDAKGQLVTASDYGDREKYITLVKEIKQTPLSLHWENMMKPLVPAYLGGGPLQY